MALELDVKKLRPNEVSLFRRVFFARLEHGAPVEAAERQALHACRIWERLGAFNEEPAKEGEEPSNEVFAPLQIGQYRLSGDGIVYRITALFDATARLETTSGALHIVRETVTRWPLVISAPPVSCLVPIAPDTGLAEVAAKFANAVNKFDAAAGKVSGSGSSS